MVSWVIDCEVRDDMLQWSMNVLLLIEKDGYKLAAPPNEEIYHQIG